MCCPAITGLLAEGSQPHSSALYFDADGSAGEFTQVKFAQFLGNVTLTENNFVVV